ncbi:MAG: SAF domain-containing protein [Nocardioides sp.]
MTFTDPDEPRTDLRTRLDRAWMRLQRATLRRRRPLAAVLTAAAVWAALAATSSPAPATVPVLVAARDLAAGTALSADDLVSVAFRPGSAPSVVLRDPDELAGRLLAAPVIEGEPITPVRLVGDDLAAAQPGQRVVPLRLADPAMVALLEVGDLIDLVATDQDGQVSTVAEGARVLALPATEASASTTASGLPGRLVVLGLRPDAVSGVVSAVLRDFVSFTWSER